MAPPSATVNCVAVISIIPPFEVAARLLLRYPGLFPLKKLCVLRSSKPHILGHKQHLLLFWHKVLCGLIISYIPLTYVAFLAYGMSHMVAVWPWGSVGREIARFVETMQ